MVNTGVVAASLDPMTNGHVWLVRQGLTLMDKLYLAIGINTSKKYYFSEDERKDIANAVLDDELSEVERSKVEVVFLQGGLVVDFATSVNASHIIRGIRDTEDFRYEYKMERMNKVLNQDIETVFFLPPSKYTDVSSSAVKELAQYQRWTAAAEFVNPIVIERLKQKQQSQQSLARA